MSNLVKKLVVFGALWIVESQVGTVVLWYSAHFTDGDQEVEGFPDSPKP